MLGRRRSRAFPWAAAGSGTAQVSGLGRTACLSLNRGEAGRGASPRARGRQVICGRASCLSLAFTITVHHQNEDRTQQIRVLSELP